jgi:hypothetical protein
MTFTVPVTATITDEELDDLTGLAQLGCDYWSPSIRFVEKTNEYVVKEQAEFGEPAEKHRFTRQHLAETVGKIAAGSLPARRDIVNYIREALLDPDDELGTLDVEAADVIFQYAALGELRYG